MKRDDIIRYFKEIASKIPKVACVYKTTLKNRRDITVAIGSAVFDFIQARNEEPDNKFLSRRLVIKEAARIIDLIGFTRVEYIRHWCKPNEMRITCQHPGIFIGKKGALIDYVVKKLKEDPNPAIAKAKLVVKEEKELDGFKAFQAYYNMVEELEDYEKEANN